MTSCAVDYCWWPEVSGTICPPCIAIGPVVLTIVLFIILIIGLALFIASMTKGSKDTPRERINLTPDQKVFIAEWFHSQTTPDYDGYLGQYRVPDEIMDVYKELYPNSWK